MGRLANTLQYLEKICEGEDGHVVVLGETYHTTQHAFQVYRRHAPYGALVDFRGMKFTIGGLQIRFVSQYRVEELAGIPLTHIIDTQKRGAPLVSEWLITRIRAKKDGKYGLRPGYYVMGERTDEYAEEEGEQEDEGGRGYWSYLPRLQKCNPIK